PQSGPHGSPGVGLGVEAQDFHQLAAGGFGGGEAGPALGAERQMRRHRQAPAFGQASGGIIDQQVVGDMMAGRHGRSPDASTTPRSLAKASRIRDFTVPSGRPSAVAMVLCDLSSKKARRSTSAWSGGSAASPSRTRFADSSPSSRLSAAGAISGWKAGSFSSNSGCRSRRNASIRMLRAMVKIQVEAAPLP